MKTKIIIIIFSIVCGEFAAGLVGQTADPVARTQLAMDSVNGGSLPLRAYEHARGYAGAVRFATYGALGALLFWPRRRGASEKQPTK